MNYINLTETENTKVAFMCADRILRNFILHDWLSDAYRKSHKTKFSFRHERKKYLTDFLKFLREVPGEEEARQTALLTATEDVLILFDVHCKWRASANERIHSKEDTKKQDTKIAQQMSLGEVLTLAEYGNEDIQEVLSTLKQPETKRPAP